MAKFLFIYRESTVSPCLPSPEEMQALQAAWYAWMQKFSSAIVPGGDGLKHTGRLLKDGLVTDGPYVEAKEIVVSFALSTPTTAMRRWQSLGNARPATRSRSANWPATHERTALQKHLRKGTKNDRKAGHAEDRQEPRARIDKKSKGFTDEERAAMKERAKS